MYVNVVYIENNSKASKRIYVVDPESDIYKKLVCQYVDSHYDELNWWDDVEDEWLDHMRLEDYDTAYDLALEKSSIWIEITRQEVLR